VDEDGGGEDHAVEPVGHAAMAFDHLAAIRETATARNRRHDETAASGWR
jgi:hypothetical protein